MDFYLTDLQEKTMIEDELIFMEDLGELVPLIENGGFTEEMATSFLKILTEE